MERCGYEAQTITSELISAASPSEATPPGLGLGLAGLQAGTGKQALRALVELLARAAAVEFVANHLGQPAPNVRLTLSSDADDTPPAKNGSNLK